MNAEPRHPLSLIRSGATAALLALASGAGSASPPPDVLAERRVAAMGTTLDVAVRMPRREDALEASERAIAEIRRVEDLLTTWRDSPLLRLNRAPAGSEVAVDAELAVVLEEVFAWSARTEGAFDPTVAPLVAAWGLRGSGRVPSPAELESALRSVGTDRFRLDAERRVARRLDAEAGIDEGAWGKGYALDRAAGALRLGGARASNAMLDLGGQVLALGANAGEPWTVEVSDPRDRRRTVATLSVENLSVSTSGNSERAVEAGGRRIGHLLDPQLGEPAPDFGAVTVVAPSGLDADVLSTAFFVLGPRRGLELSRRLRSEDVEQEVLFLIDSGGRLDAVASPGFSRLVVWADPALHGLATRARTSRKDHPLPPAGGRGQGEGRAAPRGAD
jgi:FAD:protein FMN transferase